MRIEQWLHDAYSYCRSISGGGGFAFAAGESAENFDHQVEHGGRGGENDSADDDENYDGGGLVIFDVWMVMATYQEFATKIASRQNTIPKLFVEITHRV